MFVAMKRGKRPIVKRDGFTKEDKMKTINPGEVVEFKKLEKFRISKDDRDLIAFDSEEEAMSFLGKKIEKKAEKKA